MGMLSDPEKKFSLLKKDFAELNAKAIDELNVDAVIHFAAFVSIDESMVKPEKYFENNERKTFEFVHNLFSSSSQPFLIYASSPEVYGNPVRTPMDELHPMRPRSIYAVTKLAAEKHCMSLFEWYSYPVNVIRNFNTFGPNQNVSAYSAVIPAFIERALSNEPLRITGSGEQTRDFQYVKDAVRAYESLVLTRGKLKGETFNIGSGKQIKIKGLAEKIIGLTGSSSRVEFAEGRKGDLTALQADYSKIKEKLGWQPKFSLEEGLKKTIEWYKTFRK